MKEQFKTNIKSSKRIRQPELVAPVDFNKFTPLFSFEYMDKDYCLTKCEKNEKSSFADTLRVIGQMTWGEINQAPHYGNGCEKIKVTQIKGRIPRIITEDVDSVLAFRFHNKKPMVGHRIDQTFYIIWLDRDFSLYNH
jgi:hypothetical protein